MVSLDQFEEIRGLIGSVVAQRLQALSASWTWWYRRHNSENDTDLADQTQQLSSTR